MIIEAFSIKHGVLVNSNNESYHRRARKTTRTSTTVRKSRESDERAEKRARIELEIQAEKEGSAARLKALKECKSATGKAPRIRKASKASGSRTVLVSASSSGRVATKTFTSPARTSDEDILPPLQPTATTDSHAPVASTSAAPLADFCFPESIQAAATGYARIAEGPSIFHPNYFNGYYPHTPSGAGGK
ncbi:hypothetical protein B0H17DRAFT_353969 [Mycena rosella]|uniref:Uncharacterized protein n=1 Tax=Mycena rosella TaxID=1033263 RepID=A0AAD7G555_MYCRO|nr:hypothetical protein B0H17DRAFT_353969 [Mycena rosella]